MLELDTEIDIVGWSEWAEALFPIDPADPDYVVRQQRAARQLLNAVLVLAWQKDTLSREGVYKLLTMPSPYLAGAMAKQPYCRPALALLGAGTSARARVLVALQEQEAGDAA